MADIKISQLGAAQSVNDADVLPMTANGTTVKVSAEQLKEHAIGDTDISDIGDGTPTGAIAHLDENKANTDDLSDIADGNKVVLTDVADGDEITYDAATEKWKNTSKIKSLANRVKGNWSEGGKNLLPNTAITQAINGVTFTVNDDGSITIDGTASATAKLNIYQENAEKWLKQNTAYKATVDNSVFGGISTQDCYVQLFREGSLYPVIAYFNGSEFIVPTSYFNISQRLAVQIVVKEGVTVTNQTIKPMISVASYNGDYVPYAKSNKELTEDVESIEAEMVRGGGYVYPITNNFKHITITASRGPGQFVKLITTSDEIRALTSSSAFNANLMNQQKVIRNNSNASSAWTYSIDGLTLNLNCTSDVIGCIISNYPLTFTIDATSTPEANTMDVLNLALLSNS